MTPAVGCVITSCGGREENLERTLSCLDGLGPLPAQTVVVMDGCPAPGATHAGVVYVTTPKHEPGREQPRNVGARTLRELAPRATHAWFLDSDMVVGPDVLAVYLAALGAGPQDRILIGPYDWLPDGVTEPQPDLRNDGRWASFDEHPPSDVLRHDLGAAMACFGGNLVWPLDEFERVGGFHPQLSHGRVEDGELGLRAAAAGVGMSLVAGARAWHVAHPRNLAWIMETNAREVPMLNAWHPSVEAEGLILTESDGARFDFVCDECGLSMNYHDWWAHRSQHRTGAPFTYLDPASVRSVADA